MWEGGAAAFDRVDEWSDLDLLVDVDLFMTDSAKLADLILPACTSFERNELKFYPNGYAIWTRPAISPLGESRSDVDIIMDLARRGGVKKLVIGTKPER